MGGYALFAGDTADADVYDASLTKTTVSILSAARQPNAVTAGGYAFFAGGDESSTVDVCDASLTRTTLTALSEARDSMCRCRRRGLCAVRGRQEHGKSLP